MDSYEHYSTVYDLNNQDYSWCFSFVEEAIHQHCPGARSILELGCGTGNVMQHFSADYEVSGLDISSSMIQEARRKLPGAPVYQTSMAEFRLGRKYDVVLCVFDSLNHLLDYREWGNTFACVREHVSSGGLFVFDVNTRDRLDRIAERQAFVQQTSDSFLIMKLAKKDQAVWNWNVKVFRRVKDNLWQLGEDDVQETSFELEKIKNDLAMLFGEVLLQIPDSPNPARGRAFFVCKA